MSRLRLRVKMLIVLVGVALVGMGTTTLISLATQHEDERPTYTISKPPESMDQYYPPESEQPVWLLGMLGMEQVMGAIFVNLEQGDIAGAQEAYQAFAEKYNELSKMVPEWREYFKPEFVEELGKALQSGDPPKVGEAMGKVGSTCHGCHEDNMSSVWYRYAWKDLHEISVEDPVSGEKVSFEDYMHMLSGDFGGIGVNLQRGRANAARKAYLSFRDRMEGLKTVCENCHETERYYFVSQDVMHTLTVMGVELGKAKPNPQKVGELSGQVGMASCRGCHLVHTPAAFVHEAWEHEEEE